MFTANVPALGQLCFSLNGTKLIKNNNEKKPKTHTHTQKNEIIKINKNWPAADFKLLLVFLDKNFFLQIIGILIVLNNTIQHARKSVENHVNKIRFIYIFLNFLG